ncbi:elongator complex protein 5 [Impatiens glandulifera]|uniref:elongator complex protein 5 n=1 Tax=Impatiens glandulifera TaxID=253017 RepID=UPI001FB0EA38|nr:elongator complex protein 5 [Impatiens glandulifera]
MAKVICRRLRDGVSEGEHAPALMIMDSITSPFGTRLLDHILAQLFNNILEGKSQAQCLVIVAFSRIPALYRDIFERISGNGDSLNTRIRILDCYTDPLGWKERLGESGVVSNIYSQASKMVRPCKSVRDSNNLFCSITELGKELVGNGKERFLVAIDSVSDMLRHTPTSSVASLLSNLRSHDKVSSLVGLVHSDLHDSKASAVLEYLSSMVASVESVSTTMDGLQGNTEDYCRGRLLVRMQLRTGRVRVLNEDFCIEQSDIKFMDTAVDNGGITTAQSLVPKVQFNLQLSEKERMERAKVVLPFEHQGNGKPIDIYDGRRSLIENTMTENKSSVLPKKLEGNDDNGKGGEIIYFRDSDDEMPDSDEDPDDDLDI